MTAVCPQAQHVCKFLLQRKGCLSLEDIAAKASKSFGPRPIPCRSQCCRNLSFFLRPGALPRGGLEAIGLDYAATDRRWSSLPSRVAPPFSCVGCLTMQRSMLPTEEREMSAMGAESLHTARQAVSALSFIFRDAARAEISPELLTAALSAASHMSPGAKRSIELDCPSSSMLTDVSHRTTCTHYRRVHPSAYIRRELCVCNKSIPIETSPPRRGG